MTEIQCPTCGRPNVDDHNFCDYCGAPLFSVDPLPPGSPSLRDGLFDKEDQAAPVQPPESMDEASRLDSLFAPDEPLPQTPDEPYLPTSPTNDDSRLDDLIPAPGESPAETGPQPVEESDAASRLDDFFVDDLSFRKPEQEKEELPPPAFDPFLDPSARDELLGEDQPSDKPRGEWGYLSEPSSEESAPPEKPASEWGYLSESPAEEAAPAEEPASEWGYLSESSAEETAPPEKPADAWDFLTESSAEETAPPEEPASEWGYLSESSAEESAPPEKRADEWDFLTEFFCRRKTC